MEHAIVGVDGSPASLDALRWAAGVARRAGLDLTALRVWSPSQTETEPEVRDKLRAEAHSELRSWCATAQLAFTPLTQVVEGDPAGELLVTARNWNADLVVVGPRGSGGFPRLRMGSVTHHLVHNTTVPLAIVPRPAAVSDVRHIVVGTDGSAGSAAAVRYCAEFAAALRVPVTAVLAQDPMVEWVPESDPRSWRRRAENQVRDWVAPIAAADISVEVTVDRDVHPVTALAKATQARTGAIAVVGARGGGGFAGLRLGRVPLQLVHHKDVAVIVVPAEWTGD